MLRPVPSCLAGTLVAASVVLGGCATSGGDATSLTQRWQGQPAQSFFAQYGSPFAEYGERGGGVRYTWRSRYSVAATGGTGAAAGSEVRVCEIDLVTDAADRIQTIEATRNPKVRSSETASCEGAFDTPFRG
ncbi:hypothetical protein DYI37_17520 [Fulvimarina endophytica]|uniref:DUF3617 family protein n=1 Tax=Fulvimarina endophytica TaxID=2293836 RepID=A0A371WYL3_9HYPH|nr:hypothetical protein [Fulvimarina endophytica]RFC62049.1 hypothetical protein DYI37_17520 [Fulvimarina endophytica]